VPRRGYLFEAAILRQEPPGAAEVDAARDTDTTPANPRSLAAGSVDPLLARLDEEFARRLAIAVLPLANLTGDAEYEYVADALTENLITDLSRIRDSMVITPNSVFGYKGKSVPMAQVAGDLGGQYVLTGSLQGSRPQFRVSVQLAEAETGANLWAERFDCEGPDIWFWQDQVTRRIAGTLKLGLVELASRKGLRERPEHPDAIDLTMRGLVLFSRFAGRADVVKARALFESALRLDPLSVQALVGFAGTHVLDLMLLWADDPVGQIHAADAAIARALEIDPQRAEVRYTKGNLLMLHGAHAPAIDEYRLAIDLNPSFSHAYSRIGLAKLELGEPITAFEPVLKALRLSPAQPARVPDKPLLSVSRHRCLSSPARRRSHGMVPQSNRHRLSIRLTSWVACSHLRAGGQRFRCPSRTRRIQPPHSRPYSRDLESARAIKASRVPGAA
jgi:TolB-like protein/Tfp pilus assembly protein PilF